MVLSYNSYWLNVNSYYPPNWGPQHDYWHHHYPQQGFQAFVPLTSSFGSGISQPAIHGTVHALPVINVPAIGAHRFYG